MIAFTIFIPKQKEIQNDKSIYELKQLTCHEFSRALCSPPAVNLPGDGDSVLLTGCQSSLGEGGETALRLDSYLLVTFFLFGQDKKKTLCTYLHESSFHVTWLNVGTF